ncbi:hypothetical protein [Polaromonas sp.]|uniref:hypothetical protein n=1 Tax=Polaromonas sp. TaxID=1869339 RepID=UPI0017DC451A|nr:hypothetical protein [Polaromonas sp.]NMM06340.1 hypothetical protein [Polaromonas sp.]
MTPNEIKLGSTERSDDLGTYTAYHRTCTFRDCGAELTSRNRSGSNLLCKPCAAAKARGIYTGQPRKPRTALEKAVLANRRAEPDRTKAHSLLNDCLDRITSTHTKQALQSFLLTLELRALMRHLPNVPQPQ